MLIMVFVFGCVQFAFASDSSEKNKLLDYANTQLAKRSDYKYYIGYSYEFRTSTYSSNFSIANIEGNKVCGFFETYNKGSSWGFLSDSSFEFDILDSYSWVDSRYDETNKIYYCNSASTADIVNYNYAILSNVLTFATYDDAVYYMKTGQINNAIYDNRPIEYDETIELPLMAQCQVNGDSFLFNCKQSVAHSDYTIQLNVDCRLTPVYSNFASKSYADIKQSYRTNKNEIGKYNNHGVSFNTSFSTSDLLKGIDTSRKALGFKEFYNGFYINLPYEKCTLSEIVFYARNICGNKCSNWVRVTYDLVNETSKYEEVESITGSDTPSDTKHNNSEYYPDDYLYNDNEAFNSGSDITNTLTNLKNNYSSLANFFKELFSFLPSEVWVMLIGLVGTMVIIAIVKFIRG